MATQSKAQIVSFTGGEVDEYTLGRVDLDIHPSTAERLENVFLIEQGAMELAPGTQFLRATPSNSAAILRPWVFSIDAAFCVEFSDELLRLIQGDGYVTLGGAAATVGSFTDQSAAPTSGDPPPDGGSGSPLAAVASPTLRTGATLTGATTCVVTGGSGSYSYLWANTSGTGVYATSLTAATTRFASTAPIEDEADMVCTVIDLGTGATVNSNVVAAIITGGAG